MLKEFKEFAMKGNVLDLAVGVIIGAAFGKIVTSLVNDIIMPPIGLLLGRVDFKNLFIALDGGTYASLEAAGKAPLLRYGAFINTVLEFIIVAFAVFLVVRAVNRMRREPQEQAEEAKTKTCPYCLSTIPLEATRCAQCTSDVKVGELQPA